MLPLDISGCIFYSKLKQCSHLQARCIKSPNSNALQSAQPVKEAVTYTQISACLGENTSSKHLDLKAVQDDDVLIEMDRWDDLRLNPSVHFQ